MDGRTTEAVSAFEKALALGPNTYEPHYFYGRFCVAMGDFERAVKLFIRALEIQPDDYRSPLFLQNVFNSLGRQEEREKYARLGLKRAEDALRLHPESADPAQMGAVALAALGERDRAKEWVARALVIDPDDNLIRYNAACTYSLLGEFDRAIDLLETWIQHVSSDAKLWFKNDADLDPIREHPRYAKLIELTR